VAWACPHDPKQTLSWPGQSVSPWPYPISDITGPVRVLTTLYNLWHNPVWTCPHYHIQSDTIRPGRVNNTLYSLTWCALGLSPRPDETSAASPSLDLFPRPHVTSDNTAQSVSSCPYPISDNTRPWRFPTSIFNVWQGWAFSHDRLQSLTRPVLGVFKNPYSISDNTQPGLFPTTLCNHCRDQPRLCSLDLIQCLTISGLGVFPRPSTISDKICTRRFPISLFNIWQDPVWEFPHILILSPTRLRRGVFPRLYAITVVISPECVLTTLSNLTIPGQSVFPHHYPMSDNTQPGRFPTVWPYSISDKTRPGWMFPHNLIQFLTIPGQGVFLRPYSISDKTRTGLFPPW